MPRIFLSPSTQEYNIYITGSGSEEHFMNLIADAMEPYLLANTIRFSRNTPDMTAAGSIRMANSGSYDFYLALHSNASGDGLREGAARGISPFTTPPVPTAAAQRTSSLRSCGTSILCPTRSTPAPPLRWARCASPICPPCCWSWATTTTPRTPAG